ncbi:MAG: hypothetical protein M1820_004775 [Bogoriella megaspora]|nr:MAG: hypothetical protein M1820_004775 [Bogoriella megaspora]
MSGLVAYSDSDSSDIEAAPTASKQKLSTSNKRTFEKVVDRSNPHKIKVNLPGSASGEASKTDDAENDAPLNKKPRVEGAFSGFNSFLPAPKRSGTSVTTDAKGVKGRPLGKGVNLKTGGAPGFSREPVFEPEDDTETTARSEVASNNHIDEVGSQNRGVLPITDEYKEPPSSAPEVKLVGNVTMFKPLSVSHTKPKKPKNTIPTASASTQKLPVTDTAGIKATETSVTKPKPKVSLFSMNDDEPTTTPSTTSKPYEPLLHNQSSGAQDDPQISTLDSNSSANPPAPTHPQSLNDLADSMQLSASARRQLFGRNAKPGVSSSQDAKILNFNTDTEYSYNEEYRQSADSQQMQHNPVRAIAPGKHSLQQLVNNAASQKDALEDSFSTGKGRQREAGSRYGW